MPAGARQSPRLCLRLTPSRIFDRFRPFGSSEREAKCSAGSVRGCIRVCLSLRWQRRLQQRARWRPPPRPSRPPSPIRPLSTSRTSVRGAHPSSINVSGVTGPVLKATATLRNFTHTCPQDIAVLLVGPSGANSILMGHVGGGERVGRLHGPQSDLRPGGRERAQRGRCGGVGHLPAQSGDNPRTAQRPGAGRSIPREPRRLQRHACQRHLAACSWKTSSQAMAGRSPEVGR